EGVEHGPCLQGSPPPRGEGAGAGNRSGRQASRLSQRGSCHLRSPPLHVTRCSLQLHITPIPPTACHPRESGGPSPVPNAGAAWRGTPESAAVVIPWGSRFRGCCGESHGPPLSRG